MGCVHFGYIRASKTSCANPGQTSSIEIILGLLHEALGLSSTTISSSSNGTLPSGFHPRCHPRWSSGCSFPISQSSYNIIKSLPHLVISLAKLCAWTIILNQPFEENLLQLPLRSTSVNRWTGVELDDSWQRIEYENLLELCFGCGKVDHRVEACPMTSRHNEGPGVQIDVEGAPRILSTVDTACNIPAQSNGLELAFECLRHWKQCS
ncbi:hypothetical protein LINPERHAP1_LOCUS18048 [Linum perenne]